MRLLASCILVIVLCASAAFSDEFPIASHSKDRGINATGSDWDGHGGVRVGVGGTSPSGLAMIFELPALEAGETVYSAELAFTITGGNNYSSLYNHGIHLYGVRLTDTPSVGSSDFYNGPYDEDPNATGIEEFIVFESEQLGQSDPGVTGRITSSNDVALVGWLQSLYSSASYDASGTNYAVMTLVPDEGMSDSYRYWDVSTGNNSDVNSRPVLTLTTIPEPTVISMLALGGLAILRRK